MQSTDFRSPAAVLIRTPQYPRQAISFTKTLGPCRRFRSTSVAEVTIQRPPKTLRRLNLPLGMAPASPPFYSVHDSTMLAGAEATLRDGRVTQIVWSRCFWSLSELSANLFGCGEPYQRSLCTQETRQMGIMISYMSDACPRATMTASLTLRRRTFSILVGKSGILQTLRCTTR
jgi:hypothetical protein